MKTNKGFASNMLVLIIVIVFVIGGLWYFFDKNNNLTQSGINQDSTLDLKEYKNDKLGFSFSYPKDYGEVKEVFSANQDKVNKQFIGTFSNNNFTFGTPTTDELSDSVNNQYSFQYNVGEGTSSLEKKNKNLILFHYAENPKEVGKFHAIFSLKNTVYDTVEFYGDISNENQSIIDSVKIY